MISDLDIWRAARVMVKHYGDKMMNGGRTHRSGAVQHTCLRLRRKRETREI